jgi:hypothetical protein
MTGAGVVFEESHAGRRKMALLLSLLVTSPFCMLTYALGSGHPSPLLSSLAVFALCRAASLWIALRRELSPAEWVYPAAVAPIVCCGIASASCDLAGLGFMVAVGAPVAWAAVLFDFPSVMATVLSAGLVTFGVESYHSSLGAAVVNSTVVFLIQGLATSPNPSHRLPWPA